MQQLINDTLLQHGKYRIIDFIGNGGFGYTYLAEHQGLSKRYAIKEFFVQEFCDRDNDSQRMTVPTTGNRSLIDRLRKKFIDEARALSKFNHPNIVKVVDVFEENDTAYFVMEYIEGCTLEKMPRPMHQDQLLAYMRQIADALRALHQKSCLHLDIKPANIMIDNLGNAILIDFGASKQYDEVDGHNTSTIIGYTTGYAPLEQMGQTIQSFNAATDIYALGATMYTMLTGKVPPPANILACGQALEPIPPQNACENLRNLVAHCMELRITDRPQDIDTFIISLDQCADSSAGSSKEKAGKKQPETKVVSTPTPPHPDPPKSNSNILWIVAGILAACCIALVIMINNKGTDKQSDLLSETGTGTQVVENGCGIPEIDNLAVAHSDMSAADALTEGRAQYNLGNHSTALGYLARAAQEGNGEACAMLGHCYEEGLGTAKNTSAAVTIYRRGADANDGASNNYLGHCYYRGIGVSQNYSEAVKYFQRGADLHNGDAYNNLGLCYKNGQGVKKDLYEARRWYQKGADVDDDWSTFGLAQCYQLGLGGEKNVYKALELYDRAAELGHPNAAASAKALRKQIDDDYYY